MLQKSRSLFERNIFGLIIYNAKEMEDYLEFLNESDPTVQRALQVLSDGLSYPQAPEEDEEEETSQKKKELAKGSFPEHLLVPIHHMAIMPYGAGDKKTLEISKVLG